MAAGKQYGLIVSKKKVFNLLPSVFGDDDEEEGSKAVEKELVKVGLKNKVKKQTQIAIGKVLADDPTAYEYDEVYDEMEKKKIADKTIQKPKDKKPKYIHSLMETANARQKEFENRIERKVQQEREAEGDEFADKEAFVTTAYRQKMEERAKMEEEAKKKELLESIMDVTKQKDLSGFYRHILKTKVGEDTTPNEGEEKDPKMDISTPEDEKPEETKPDDQKSKPEEEIKQMEEKPRENNKRKKRSSRSRSRSRSRDRSHRRHSPNKRRNRSVDRHGSHKMRFRSSERESRRRRSPERDSRRRRSPERDSRRPRSPEKDSRRPRSSERDRERRPRKDKERVKRRSREKDGKRRDLDDKLDENDAKKKRRSLKQILEIYKRRNGEKEIAEMKERFLERKKRREAAVSAFRDEGE
uniref:Nuclear speckle splicing regulatory protein 1 N-terminal domain-containing protein n=1 Tax=Strigamia maritima TaxID=126957 RepID=T1INQ1_STRMM